MHRAPFLCSLLAGLAASVSAHAQTYAQPMQVAMVTQPSLEARLEALIAANRQLTAQVGELQQQLASYQAQAAPPQAATPDTIYVNTKANSQQQYENWFGLAIGDRWRLQEDTPLRLLEPNDSKLAYRVLPAGTVVTIIGAPRGTTGIYAIAVDSKTSGWASLRSLY